MDDHSARLSDTILAEMRDDIRHLVTRVSAIELSMAKTSGAWKLLTMLGGIAGAIGGVMAELVHRSH